MKEQTPQNEIDSFSPTALSASMPRYSLADLPVEYIPLNEKSLISGTSYGPLNFHIPHSSHQHHIDYLSRCNVRPSTSVASSLLPFEFWPLPRVLCQLHYGRLNEVISIRADRVIEIWPVPGESLIGETKVKSVAKRNGLCFAFCESITKNSSGNVCMFSEDVLLLANGCDIGKLRTMVRRVLTNQSLVHLDSPSDILCSWNLQMRYKWPEEKWLNNIHTDTYANYLGYTHGLVEGPGVADLICAFDRSQAIYPAGMRYFWEYIGPLHDQTPVVLLQDPHSNEKKRSYMVCELPIAIPGDCRVLLKMEVKLT